MANNGSASLGGISISLGINSGTFLTGLQAAERGLNSAADVAEEFAQIIAKTATPMEALVAEMDKLRALQPFAQTTVQAQALAREMENLSGKFGDIFQSVTQGPIDEARKAIRSFRRDIEEISTEGAASKLDALNKITGRSSQFMLNFGRTLQDLPFGLTAIANNVPELINQFGEISRATKEAGTGTSTLGAIMGSLKGPMLGIVALGFASALYELAKNTDAFKNATRALSDMMRELTATAADSRKALDDFGRALATESIKKNRENLSDLKQILAGLNEEVSRMKFGDHFASQTAKMAVEMTRMKLLAEQGARENRQIQIERTRADAEAARREADLIKPKSAAEFINPFTAAKAVEDRQRAVALLETADQLDEKANMLQDISKNRLRVEKDIETQYAKQKEELDKIIAKEQELINLKTGKDKEKQAEKDAKAAQKEQKQREAQADKAADSMIGFSDFVAKQAADLEKMGITNRAQEGVSLALGAGTFEPMAAVLRNNIDPLTGALIDMGKRFRTTGEDLSRSLELMGKQIEVYTKEAIIGLAEQGIAAAQTGDIFGGTGLGQAIGGVVGGLFGAPQIGAAVGGALGPALDDLAHSLGVVDPLMATFAEIIAVFTPALQMLEPVFEALEQAIAPLVAPLQAVLAFFGMPLLVIGRALQLLSPIVAFVGEVFGLAADAVMDLVKGIDQFMVGMVNKFIEFINYLIIGINGLLRMFGSDSRMELLKATESVFLTQDELTDATEDNTEAVRELSRQINNLPSFYKLGGAIGAATTAGGGPALGVTRTGEIMIGTVNVTTTATNMAQLAEDIRGAARQKQRRQGRMSGVDYLAPVANTGVF